MNFQDTEKLNGSVHANQEIFQSTFSNKIDMEKEQHCPMNEVLEWWRPSAGLPQTM